MEVSICQSVVPSSNSGKLELQLIYQNEEGLCFFRCNSSVQCVSDMHSLDYSQASRMAWLIAPNNRASIDGYISAVVLQVPP